MVSKNVYFSDKNTKKYILIMMIDEGGNIGDDDGDDLIFSSVSLESLYMLSLSHKPQKFLKSISDFVQF